MKLITNLLSELHKKSSLILIAGTFFFAEVLLLNSYNGCLPKP